MLAALLILTGPAVGLLSTFFGVGGGVILIPVLYALFPEVPPQTVISCSLGVICFNSMNNTRNFLKIGRKPKLGLALCLGAGLTTGILLGNQLTYQLTPRNIKLFFAVVLCLVILRLLFVKPHRFSSPIWDFQLRPKTGILVFIVSALGGTISGLTGLGGGIILVPILLTILRAPFNWIPPHTNMAMIMSTGSAVLANIIAHPSTLPLQNGFLKYFQFGYFNFGISLLIFLGSMTTSKLGARLSQRVDPNVARWCFAALITIVATRIFLTA